MNHESVRSYYGETLETSADLKTDACCTPGGLPPHLKTVMGLIHEQVQAKYYGCGLIAPLGLEGARILDLGCGAGRDVFLLSALVGEEGEVVGVDMTPEQLAVARAHQEYHAEAFGHARPNTAFHEGYIERLDELPLEPGSFDIVVSNCVLNLATDKEAVLRGVHRLLREGGEFHFSDVYADRRIPEALRQDEVLYGECLSGALYWNDFERIARRAGFADPRVVEDRPLAIRNPEIEAKIGHVGFTSATYRLFRIDGLEPSCEDYGQAVIYRGTLRHSPAKFVLDKHHVMEAGKVFPVCSNTWRMLAESRFQPHFEFVGKGDVHYGLFAGCGGRTPFGPAGGAPAEGTAEAGSCGCG